MKLLTFATAAWLVAASTASAQVTVTMQDGLVSIVAKDVTVRQILAEWAQVGQTKIVNAERLAGGPISLEVTNMPEGMVLDTLLRGAAGYVAAPRPTRVAGLSTFDRVIVMPTSSAPRAATTAPPPPVFQQPQFVPPRVADDDSDDERPQPNAQAPMPNPRGPVFNTFPQQPQVINPQTGQPVVGGVPQQVPVQQAAPQQTPMSTATPSSPYGGVAVPGMIVPAPTPQQQPGVIVPPQQPGQVRRPGGRQ